MMTREWVEGKTEQEREVDYIIDKIIQELMWQEAIVINHRRQLPFKDSFLNEFDDKSFDSIMDVGAVMLEAAGY